MLTPILFVLVLTVLVPAAVAGFMAAPWVPMRAKDTSRMVRLARVEPGETFLDMGSGDGRMCVAVVRAEPRAYSRGIELSVLPFLWSKVSALVQKVSNIDIRFGNLFSADISNVDVIAFFLMPKAMPRIKEKIEKEGKIGVRIFSYVFPVPGWEPVRIDKPDQTSIAIYEYRR